MSTNLLEVDDQTQLKRELLAVKERQLRLREGLPFLHGWKWYPWARAFFESTNKLNFLCAANQISKSSTQIRKCIDWATDQSKWGELWPAARPVQFWYLYPTSSQANIEFLTKWSQFLPKNEFKEDPHYGWKEEKKQGNTYAIHFNSGVHVFFKTYAQDSQALQTGTCDALFCFEGHCEVMTPSGLHEISSLKPGGFVCTGDGNIRRVDACYSRRAKTIRRILSTGEYIDATPDHRIRSQEGMWVNLEDLTPMVSLGVQAEWRKEKKRRIEAKLIFGTQRANTDSTDIFRNMETSVESVTCILKSSAICVGKFLLGGLSTIWMKIRGTARLATWPVSRRLRTHVSINYKNGSPGFLALFRTKLASVAGKNSLPRLPKEPPRWSALVSVGEFIMEQAFCVKLALLHLCARQTPSSVFVLKGAWDRGENEVFCLNVAVDHNFQVCGIIGKNCDEELPVDLYDELIFRISASDGYFHMVFTATLGQEYWRLVMEPGQKEEEKLPEAFKQTVSMYDCQLYEDGTPSRWTEEAIQRTKNRCKTANEILKRVYGKFILDDGGRKYESFDVKRHVKKYQTLPGDWITYSGSDIGGGGRSHPGAIVFVKVSPDFRQGRVFLGWRGDGIGDTTAGDIYNQHQLMKKEHELHPVMQSYDHGCKDFRTIADRNGGGFTPADKDHDRGEDFINTLFKNDMLFIYETEELNKLILEVASLRRDTPKNKAKDDFTDALRYAVTRIPWDWSAISDKILAQSTPEEPLNEMQTQVQERRKQMSDVEENDRENQRIEEELEEWQGLLDGG